MLRYFWLSLGFASVGLAVIGIVLPLLPTTPFLLMAAFCFSRSSQRFHDWLLDHPRLGPGIRTWRAHGAIGRRAKFAAIGALAGALGLTVLVGLEPWIIGVQALVALCVATFILTRPDGPAG